MSYINPISLPPRPPVASDRSRTVSGARRNSGEGSEREVELTDAVELSSDQEKHPDERRRKQRQAVKEASGSDAGQDSDGPAHLDLTA